MYFTPQRPEVNNDANEKSEVSEVYMNSFVSVIPSAVAMTVP